MAYISLALVLLASLLISLPTPEAKEESCVGATCVSAHGSSMLQITNRGSMKANAMGRLGDVVETLETSRTHCGLRTNPMEVTKEEYESVKESCCLYAMAEFVKQVAETHRVDEHMGSHMGYTVCELGFAPGVAVWHGCDGEGKDKTFEDLLTQIVVHADDPCTTLAKPGQQCQPRPSTCTDYPGASPVNCGCSRSKSMALDFTAASLTVNNLGGVGPDTGPNEIMRFDNVGTYHGDIASLEISVLSPGYFTGNASLNGVKGEFARISVGLQRRIRFKLMFKDSNGNELSPDELALTMADIDGPATGHQVVRAWDISGYVLDDNSQLAVSKDPDGAFVFKGENPLGNIENPKEVDVMTPEQRSVSVMLLYKGVSDIIIELENLGGTAPNPPSGPKDHRNFFIAGMSALGDHCAD